MGFYGVEEHNFSGLKRLPSPQGAMLGVDLKVKNLLQTELVHKSAGPIYSRLQKGANVIPHFAVADFCLRKSSCPVNLGHVWRLF